MTEREPQFPADGAAPHPAALRPPSPRERREGVFGRFPSRRSPDPAQETFVEPEWVSRRLFEDYPFDGWIVDPCAGSGSIPRSAKAAGFKAFGSDLIPLSEDVVGGIDFLHAAYRLPTRAPWSIVCNPPFSRLREFAEKAVALTLRSALLAPAHRLAAAHWLEALPLSDLAYVTPRPSMLPYAELLARIEAGEPLGAGRQDFAWLIFDRLHAIRRVGWLHRERS